MLCTKKSAQIPQLKYLQTITQIRILLKTARIPLVEQVEENATTEIQTKSPKTYADIVKSPVTKNSMFHRSVTWDDTELGVNRTRKGSTLLFTGKTLLSSVL